MNESKPLRRRTLGAFVIAVLLAILARIDLDRYRAFGSIRVGRENQLLSGSAAESMIGVFALGAIGALAVAIYSAWALWRLERDADDDGSA